MLGFQLIQVNKGAIDAVRLDTVSFSSMKSQHTSPVSSDTDMASHGPVRKSPMPYGFRKGPVFCRCRICIEVVWKHRHVQNLTQPQFVNSHEFCMKLPGTAQMGLGFVIWLAHNSQCDISMGQCRNDVTPLLTHWSYVFLALIHRYMRSLYSPCKIHFRRFPRNYRPPLFVTFRY